MIGAPGMPAGDRSEKFFGRPPPADMHPKIMRPNQPG